MGSAIWPSEVKHEHLKSSCGSLWPLSLRKICWFLKLKSLLKKMRWKLPLCVPLQYWSGVEAVQYKSSCWRNCASNWRRGLDFERTAPISMGRSGSIHLQRIKKSRSLASWRAPWQRSNLSKDFQGKKTFRNEIMTFKDCQCSWMNPLSPLHTSRFKWILFCPS